MAPTQRPDNNEERQAPSGYRSSPSVLSRDGSRQESSRGPDVGPWEPGAAVPPSAGRRGAASSASAPSAGSSECCRSFRNSAGTSVPPSAGSWAWCLSVFGVSLTVSPFVVGCRTFASESPGKPAMPRFGPAGCCAGPLSGSHSGLNPSCSAGTPGSIRSSHSSTQGRRSSPAEQSGCPSHGRSVGA